jgi:hypothetical protein
MDSNLDVNTGLPIFLLTNNHPEKFFEKSTYQFEPQAVANVNKLKQIFFSTENVKYIQEKLRYEVFASSNNKYRIPYQNERDLRMIMETIYMNKTRNIGYLLNEQLSELNDYVVKFCVPKILNEAKVYLKYLVDIEKPREINTLPQSSGRLRSVAGLAPASALNENIYLPNMAAKYTWTTTGDINDLDLSNTSGLSPSVSNPNAPSYIATMAPSSWLPSSVAFPEDPYYIRNSLLSPFAKKPIVNDNSFPNETNGLFSAAYGTTNFLPYNDDKYAMVVTDDKQPPSPEEYQEEKKPSKYTRQ